MKLNRRPVVVALTVVFAMSTLVAQETVDLDAVHKIREEALQNSQVMEHLFYLTDVSGSRLTNSPGVFNAADWVVKRLGEWGISAHQEKWGPFGRGWVYTRFAAHMLEPQSTTLIGAPLAYPPGTNGAVTGDAVIVAINNESDFAKYKGTLEGKMVLLGPGRELQMSVLPLAARRSDADLAALALAPDAAVGRGAVPPGTTAIRGGRQGG